MGIPEYQALSEWSPPCFELRARAKQLPVDLRKRSLLVITGLGAIAYAVASTSGSAAIFTQVCCVTLWVCFFGLVQWHQSWNEILELIAPFYHVGMPCKSGRPRKNWDQVTLNPGILFFRHRWNGDDSGLRLCRNRSCPLAEVDDANPLWKDCAASALAKGVRMSTRRCYQPPIFLIALGIDVNSEW